MSDIGAHYPESLSLAEGCLLCVHERSRPGVLLA